MKFAEILQLVKNLESDDIYELLNNRGVVIEHRPELFTCSKSDARIITSVLGNTCIFLRLRSGENPQYENYILWHELGHYILHYHPTLKMNYRLTTYRELLEQEANLFAVFGVLVGEDLTDTHGIDAAIRHGVPPLVAADIFKLLYTNGYRLE